MECWRKRAYAEVSPKRFESLAQHGVYVKAIRSNLTGKIGPDGWEP